MKSILVINIADDIAENYKDFTVDYDLRGTPIDNEKVNESIRYVEDCPLKPMPQKKWHEEGKENECEEWYKNGWNDCIDAITGETE